MQTLELKDDVAEQLKQVAKQAHLSTNDLIAQFLNKYITEVNKKPILATDIIKGLPEIKAFKGGDPVDIQRKMRNEWN